MIRDAVTVGDVWIYLVGHPTYKIVPAPLITTIGYYTCKWQKGYNGDGKTYTG